MLSLSLDHDATIFEAFVQAQKMEWNHARLPKGWSDPVVEAYHVRALPSVFIIGGDGKIAAAGVPGSRLGQELERILSIGDD
jgi:hypothetical protein